ncbi:rRNA maturation RNase YbeY [Candidatus Nomurabacteria bacterium RIFCSPLOWO2_01_FULL_33_24]|uniref:Endoribonuclease YbeY n=1 Tax=Candidatus Nomurabacteria bacterium RIFCSPLOWO2_01_FULL_33_24 TaxID=1801765 RepID=A0A1F6WZ64_9BACT|nr:MAG: rRNA maturation RNase YbeY [Candidatus Nomurabacteria bacterium RIFCSPLOWO2_01_FULL_33_24]
MNNKNVLINNLTKGKLLSLPFVKLKESILGKTYELSLVFVGQSLSQKLNKKYLGKDKPANILSFPLSNKSGEIIINLNQIKKEFPLSGKNYRDFLGSIVIHGLFHLKGMDHSSKMEEGEDKLIKKFNF